MDKPIALTHPFVQEIPDVDEFFRSNNEAGHINTINGFCERVKALSAKYAPVPDPEDKAKSKYKGGAGEVLAEFLIKDMGHENRIGIFDYRPVNANDDTGVDGEGFGANEKPATVQVKFREGGWILRANEDHLSNFIAASQNKYHVCPEDDKNMLIITTGLKVDEFTMQEMLYGKVRCLNREALREMMDNRPNAWLRFYEAWKSSRIQQVAPVITKVLRDNQVEAVDAMAGKTKGVIVRPTGTGKSLIMAEKIYRTITEELAAHRFPVIKVNTPRIILNFQDFEEIFKYLNERGIVAKYVNFCSGSTEEKEYRELLAMSGHYLPRDVTDTTSTQRVLIEHDRAKREGVPFIVISTYNSSEKFAKSGIVPTITCHDEAHRLVSKEFCDVHMQQSGADFFFTATPRITKPSEITDTTLDLGMRNEERFGPWLHSKTPKQMIDAGEMVPPYVHVVTVPPPPLVPKLNADAILSLPMIGDTDYSAMFRSIEDAFFRHDAQVKARSATPDEIGAKTLIVCRGQQDLIQMESEFTRFRERHPEAHVFALSSTFGLYDDGERINAPVTCRKKCNFLKKIQALTPVERCLIFHVDMLGEGINVPGITGVMPFRNCDLIPFLQNLGRAARLALLDRLRLYADPPTLTTTDRKGWVKPVCWLIIPSFLANAATFEDRFRTIIRDMRDNYGFVPTQEMLIDNDNGLSPKPEIGTDNVLTKNRPRTDSGIDRFNHEFETVEMSMAERVLREDTILQERARIHSELLALTESVR